AIDTLKYYVENDGHTFIFHETISEKTPNLTANFRQLFGQDYNHLTVEKTYGPPKANLNVKAIQNGWGNTQYSSTNINSTQGLDLNITFNGSSESVTATPTNNTGVLNINWTNNGWSGGNANYYGIGVRIEVDGVMLTAIKPDNSRTGHITENLEFRQLLGAKNASEDEDRYLLPNITKNDSEVLSSTHLTYYVKDGTLTQNGKDNWFTYTQTGMEKNADLKNPVVHSSTDSTAFELQGSTFTSVATQTNKGVVTMYPFKIGSRLRIAGTHPNSFSTDIEDKNMVVYYSLNGGAKGTASATVAADPQNGIDNYWLYSYGNLTYCGAGHQNVTGLHRDNNDERRLFINVILNSGRKSIFKGDPEIKVFDSTTTEESNESNLIVKEVDGAYELVVTTNTDTPEFTFRTNVPNKKLDVEEVHIYYDCTPDVNEEHLNDVDDYGFNGSAGEVINGKKYVDTMIFNKKSTEDPKLLKDQYKQMLGEQNVQLKLKPEYFAPYNYEHTVIVIAVKTSDGNVYKQKVVIKLAPKLWDLT
ncbi:MAG: hypothetical protein IKN79_09570, partial [Eubacterium sp.]|nr:hypothetical protein [Eubacterium sp.]